MFVFPEMTINKKFSINANTPALVGLEELSVVVVHIGEKSWYSI